MANGQATITFDGIDLDNCIKQGLEFTGYAKCPNCKQIYSFQISLKTQKKKSKYIDTEINGKTVTVLAPDHYDVSIEFSRNRDLPEDEELPVLLDEPDEPGVKAPCIPCSRCTPNCQRLNFR